MACLEPLEGPYSKKLLPKAPVLGCAGAHSPFVVLLDLVVILLDQLFVRLCCALNPHLLGQIGILGYRGTAAAARIKQHSHLHAWRYCYKLRNDVLAISIQWLTGRCTVPTSSSRCLAALLALRYESFSSQAPQAMAANTFAPLTQSSGSSRCVQRAFHLQVGMPQSYRAFLNGAGSIVSGRHRCRPEQLCPSWHGCHASCLSECGKHTHQSAKPWL